MPARRLLAAITLLGGLVACGAGGVGEPGLVVCEIAPHASTFGGHPNYNSSNVTEADVGLVLVDRDLGRRAVPLLLSRDGRVGETAVVAGWGRDLQNETGRLRAGATTLTGVNSSVLRTQYSTMSSGICQGDSGGPILLSEGGAWAIAGSISASSATTCNTGEHYYAAISANAIRSFVLENVQGVSSR